MFQQHKLNQHQAITPPDPANHRSDLYAHCTRDINEIVKDVAISTSSKWQVGYDDSKTLMAPLLVLCQVKGLLCCDIDMLQIVGPSQSSFVITE